MCASHDVCTGMGAEDLLYIDRSTRSKHKILNIQIEEADTNLTGRELDVLYRLTDGACF